MGYFEQAIAAGDDGPLAVAGLADALARSGRGPDAAPLARTALTRLEGGEGDASLAGPPWPPGFESLRIDWEEAGWHDPAAKRRHLAGYLHALLAELTGDLGHAHAAVLARPHDAPTRAALGCALARADRFAEAVPHLGAAVAADPFDRAAARADYQALTDAADLPRRAAVVRDRQRLHAAAPGVVPPDDWFRVVPPDGGELASVIVLCCNELAYTRLCLASVLAHTRRPFELVLVDNGSTDGTGEYLASLATRREPERVRVVALPTNVGYPAGVNAGLRVAAGEYLVLLNNDTVVARGWLDGLARAAAAGWPHVGLVGAVSNYAGGVQQVPVPYADVADAPAFAARHRLTHAGRTRPAPKLTGFCLLATRAALDRVGPLDERFGLGFFDDDDLSRRAVDAGFRLLVAEEVFVHHFGSRTFAALGVDTARQLHDNLALYRQKWGADAPRDIAPAAPPRASDSPVSLTMIVRNEEHNLAACLEPLRHLVGEMIVVDTGSTDDTKGVAARMGAKVFDFPWVDHFAAARNEALRHATRPWIFWMDADDRLDTADAAKLWDLFASLKDENAAYVVQCECVADAPGGAVTVVDHVRLFRNDPRVRWTYRVHEQILPALRRVGADVRWSGVTVRHVGYVDPAVRSRKLDRDTRLLRLELDEHPDDPFALFNLGAVLHERGDYAAAVPVLEKSLRLSHPKDSIVRKLYALVAQCHARLGDREAALAAIRGGRGHYPDDAELLFLEAGLLRDAKDLPAAEDAYRRLIAGREAPHFASVDTGLRRHKARHNLGLVLLDQGRRDEASGEFRTAVDQDPSFLPAWLALAELAARGGDRAEGERIAARLDALGPVGQTEAAKLRQAMRAAGGRP